MRTTDSTIANNLDLTSRQIHGILVSEYPALAAISLSTVKRALSRLGWESKRTRYCALISERNVEKRLKFCKDLVDKNDMDFGDVIWTDECSVLLESHRKVIYHRKGEPAKMCPIF